MPSKAAQLTANEKGPIKAAVLLYGACKKRPKRKSRKSLKMLDGSRAGWAASPVLLCWLSFAAVACAKLSPQQFNVKDYGAKGDGITDDHAAIQRAIDAATNATSAAILPGDGTFLFARASVWFPFGRYYLTQSLRLRGLSAPFLEGDGMPVLQAANA